MSDTQIAVYEENISELAKSSPNAVDTTVTIVDQELTASFERRLEDTQLTLKYAIQIKAISMLNAHKFFAEYTMLMNSKKEVLLTVLQKIGVDVVDVGDTISLGSLSPSTLSGSNNPVSASPSLFSSVSPSMKSKMPSLFNSPSSRPTDGVTYPPTYNPSEVVKQPSIVPISAEPSVMVSSGPSGDESDTPSNLPSQSSSSPSNKPSIKLSKPNINPSSLPTTRPSDSTLPSVSTKPSNAPSDARSISIVPSSSPTLSPSFAPTISTKPSDFPSDIPSTSPSASPSHKPSLSPSETPSMVPSAAPSLPTQEDHYLDEYYGGPGMIPLSEDVQAAYCALMLDVSVGEQTDVVEATCEVLSQEIFETPAAQMDGVFATSNQFSGSSWNQNSSGKRRYPESD